MANNKVELTAAQTRFMASDKRMVLFAGGIGSGKSYAGSLWALKMVLQNQGCNGFITANTHSQLQKATLSCFFGVLEDFDIPYEYNSVDKIIKIGDAKIYCVSMENYDTLRGIEVGWAWSDECAFYKKAAFNVLLGRIRDKKGPCHWRGTSTPNGFNWLWERFVETPSENTHVVYGSTKDNVDNLTDEYINLLEEQYDSKLAQQEIEGKFINTTEGMLYHAFHRAKHVREFNHEGKLIWMGLDFNVDPLCGVFAFFEDNGAAKKIYIFDELYQRNSDTFKAAKEIISRFPMQHIRIVADETGNRRKTNSAKTDHQILEQSGLEVVHFKNPLVKDRTNNINRHLEQGNLIIHPRCENLIKDLEFMTVDNNDNRLSHLSDALGYVVWKLIPFKKPRRRAKVSYMG